MARTPDLGRTWQGLAWVALVLAVYAPSLGASFQFDDFNVILADPRVQSLDAWLASMPAIRPVLRLSYALNHAWLPGVVGFRAVNIAIHAACTVFVWLLFERLAAALGSDARRARRLGGITALLFAFHPVQTEAVTYVSGRSSALAALFSMAALWLWVATPPAGRHRTLSRIGALICALAALGTKETAAALPLAMLAWIAVTPAAPPPAPRRRWDVVVLCIAFGILAVGLGLGTPYGAMLRSSLALRTPVENLLTQVNAVSYLLGHVVRLDALNADPRLSPTLYLDVATTLRLGALALLLLAAVLGLRRRPAVSFGVLWCAIWLAPTHSVFAREDVANDRQLYLALAGIAWLAALAILALAERLPREVGAARPRDAIVLAGILGLILATATVLRNETYRTEIRFWEDVRRKSPENARAAGNLGYAYALACRDTEALALLETANRLDPSDARTRANIMLLRRGRLFAPDERSCPGRN
jgi:hypothetical protein